MSVETKTAGWVTIENQSVFTWHYEPAALAKSLVLLVPPFGHEAFHAHRFYKLLALHLQNQGHRVVRFDWPGCGDSSGDTAEEYIHESWPKTIKALINQFSETLPVNLIGLRMGANLASATKAHKYILIDPIFSPKRFVRELTATAKLADSVSDNLKGIEAGGYYYSETLLSWIPNQHLIFTPSIPTLVLCRQTKKAEALRQPDLDLTIVEEAKIDSLIAEPQFTEIPNGMMQRIEETLETEASVVSAEKPVFQSMLSELACGHWRERTVKDELGQFGIITEPVNADVNQPLLVFVNSGSGVHTGPNRVYVEASRHLAKTHGLRTCRFDLYNLGDSATADVDDENHCYPKHATEYTLRFLDFLQQQNIADDVYLAGICSGAHHAYHAAIHGHPALKHILLINPLTFYWQEGMSLVTPDNQRVTVDSNYYAQKIKDPRAWVHLLKGKANLRYISKFASKLLMKKLNVLGKSIGRIINPIPSTQLNQDMQKIQVQGIGISILIADSDPGWGLIADASQLPKKTFLKRFNISDGTVRNANHTFSKTESRARLQLKIEELLPITVEVQS